MRDNETDTDDKYLSDLYSELSQEQPSESLDAKILSAARAEVSQSKENSDLSPPGVSSDASPDYSFRKNNSGPFSGNWRIPVSLAAVIVLSVAVVVTIEKERPYSLTSPPEISLAPQPAEVIADSKPLAESIPKKNESGKVSSEAKMKPAPQMKSVFADQEVMALQKVIKSENQVPAKTKIADANSPAKKVAPQIQRMAALNEELNKEERKIQQDDVGAVKGDSIPAEQGAGSAAPSAIASAKPATEPAAVAKAVSTTNQKHVSSAVASVADASPDLSRPEPEKQSEEEMSDVEQEAAAEPAESPSLAIPEKSNLNKESQISREQQKLSTSVAVQETLERQQASSAASAPQAVISSAISARTQTGLEEKCSSLSVNSCIASKECTLEHNSGDGTYRCRTSTNPCEKDFSQDNDTRQICESRQGCKYQAAKCFCPPGVECVCGGGTPAMCILEN